ncbi:AraC family transcriptional regulator [Phytohabitans kaempferiae]|uniref:Helix-turn-helix domain-containing protein n=1 Tax=Phytohabitans kaempferiae TaxID=1620943 RepID=A0ABV6M154_9ACTN
MTFTIGRPEPRLRPIVGRYTGYEERVAGVECRRELPGSKAVFLVGWGDPLDVAHPRAPGSAATGVTSFTGGLFDAYAETTFTGVGRGVQLMLDPFDAGRLFGLPIGELANRVVPLDVLPGGWARDLAARLAEAPGWPSRFALLDAAFVARLADAPSPDRRVEWAWRRLCRSHGRVAVGTLAAEVGWSRRHLAASFRRELGLTPKVAARVLRFAHAYAVASSPSRAPGGGAGAGGEGWAGVAAACGYHDQAHLIRDFRKFAGTTPGRISTIRPEHAG